jgi:group I intron endonuclease
MKTITYRAVNKNNGKWYVGSTTRDLQVRASEHLMNETNDPFHNALRKNPDNFQWEVLSEIESEKVDRSHEQEVLDVWYGSSYCYNVSSSATGMCPNLAKRAGKLGGDSNVKNQTGMFTPECREKLNEWATKGGKSSWGSLTEIGQKERIDHLKNAAKDLHSKTDEQGRSLHAVKTLGEFYTNSEHQRNASLAAHSDKDELGRSLLTVRTLLKVHDEKDEWGRSKHAVERSNNLNKAKQWLFTDSETGEEFGPFPSSSIASARMGIKKNTIKNRANTGKLTEGYIITSY